MVPGGAEMCGGIRGDTSNSLIPASGKMFTLRQSHGTERKCEWMLCPKGQNGTAESWGAALLLFRTNQTNTQEPRQLPRYACGGP